MSDEKVIHIFKPSDDLPPCPMEVKSSSPVFHCNHRSLQIDTHERTVRCDACCAMLDPFDYIARNGQSLQMAWRDYRIVRDRIKALNESVERLAREEKRLKASIRRTKQKIPDRLDVRGEP
ncbi:hypothetical protein [Dyella terrae]|jgi:hypothetical protein|uniref:hypothetical protein n=1 Tax=Dyella terrae TaxID=522259 RepID=UPI001EFDC770|nr:hypothetical protein [Dyella terrae]ULU26613.1 hypothetical protein DYST_03559 [Dyella terrae]